MEWSKQYDGILLVDKPSGVTSHDVVNKIRTILRQREVGHTGTLDPLSTGLLVLCLGRATKVAQFLSSEYKAYIAEICLGIRSTTYDREGVDPELKPESLPDFTPEQLKKALNDYLGLSIQQVPLHSAVRVKGQHLYEIARKGETTKLPEREIEITEIEMLSYKAPFLQFRLTCSKGTYVRSLAHDIGEELGCGAYLNNLRRISVANLTVEQAVTMERLEAAVQDGTAQSLLLSIEQALPLASITLTAESTPLVRFGRAPLWQDILSIDGTFATGEPVLAKDPNGTAIAVAVAGAPSKNYQSRTGNPVSKYMRVLI